MLGAQGATLDLQDLAQQRLGLVQLAPVQEHQGQVVHRRQRGRGARGPGPCRGSPRHVAGVARPWRTRPETDKCRRSSRGSPPRPPAARRTPCRFLSRPVQHLLDRDLVLAGMSSGGRLREHIVTKKLLVASAFAAAFLASVPASLASRRATASRSFVRVYERPSLVGLLEPLVGPVDAVDFTDGPQSQRR